MGRFDSGLTTMPALPKQEKKMNTLNLDTKLDGISIPHSFNLSRDEEAKHDGVHIRIHGTFVFDGVTMNEALQGTVATARIAWQGANRPEYDKLEDGQKVTILVKTAGRKQVDHTAAVQADFAGATIERQRKILAKVMNVTPDEVPDELLKVDE